MATKTLGYRTFGFGRLPSRWLQRLEAEGILVRDEGVSIQVTYRHYRAPGRRYGFKRSLGSGSFALTKQRLAVFYYRWPVFNLPMKHDAWSSIALSVPQASVVQITCDASSLDSQKSGQVEIRMRTERAIDVLGACIS